MRSHKLTSAVMAAAALLALATAGAAAARSTFFRHSKNGHRTAGVCRVSLRVAPRLITAGETALAYGTVLCSGVAEAGETVTVYERAAGSPGYTVAGTTTTDSHGAFQVTTPALTANAVFYAAAGTGRSGLRNVRVAAQVTLAGPAETKQLRTGRRNAVTFTGTVSPDDAGAMVVLQRENALRGQEWHRIGQTIVNSSGGFAITHAFAVPGASDIRVVVRSNHRNIASPSNALSYAISQAQNPSLTIESSEDPIAVGGSTVISGTAASAPGVTLTLYGRTAAGTKTLATTTTNSEGRYSFPAQSPATSTFYRVAGAGRSSAVLYEGVKFILAMAPPPTSVPSGQPLTVTGTVTPAVAGHAIYLERQNAGGVGFHVVAIGTVQANGSYTLTRIFYAPGTDVLRVRIPGDIEYDATASPTFDVTVTPLSSAITLGPEPGNNGTLPPEGQV